MEELSLPRYIVILAGGGGSRLWPKSRSKTPKQFLKLFGEMTLLQTTFERVVPLVGPRNVIVVTSGEFKKTVKEQLPKLPSENILVEPLAAGTAAAVGLAVAFLGQKHENAIISTVASDHYISDSQKFLESLSFSQETAGEGEYIVTMGLEPIYPHTGLGYIHAGKEVLRSGKHSALEVLDFTEKPDEKTARRYLRAGKYFWNANINSYQLQTISLAFKEHMPDLYKTLQEAQGLIGKRQDSVLTVLWQGLKQEAIDTGVLEKAKNVLVVPASFGWMDIGDWSVLHSYFAEQSDTNVVLGDQTGEIIFVDSKDTLISSPNKVVAIVGVDDLVVIDTPDALLVCRKSRAQDVKKIVEELKRRSLKSYL
jgi:mannose-1-phosphate guanylyltransferase